MSDLLGRAYVVAKGYLDAARDRLEAVDAQAQEELRRALPRENAGVPPSAPSPGESGGGQEDDPFARASAKIAAAQALASTQRQELDRREQATAPPDPVATAYKIIGVPAGSDAVTVRAAVDQLRARCAPARFPDGSSEQAEARVILQRVEEASQVLQNALPPQSGSRFDKLEL